MTLYEFLSVCQSTQRVWICLSNNYDQNMPVFKGDVQKAKEADDVWWHLKDTVEIVQASKNGKILVKVMNENRNKLFEDCYMFSDPWGEEKGKIPWKFSFQLAEEFEREQEE